MASKRKQKKEQFTRQQKTTTVSVKKTHLVLAAVILGIAFVMFSGTGPAATEDITAIQEPAGTASQGFDKDPESYYIPIANINDGVAHFYEYPSTTGKTIRFFVLKSSDGILRAAFDACDVCYRENKGYRQEGDYMVCNNCGLKFASNKINEIKGGCNPSPLARSIVDETGNEIALANPPESAYLVIKKADIEKGANYFP